jgi:hypothetical protein
MTTRGKVGYFEFKNQNHKDRDHVGINHQRESNEFNKEATTRKRTRRLVVVTLNCKIIIMDNSILSYCCMEDFNNSSATFASVAFYYPFGRITFCVFLCADADDADSIRLHTASRE